MRRFLKCVKMPFIPPKSEIGCKEKASMKNKPMEFVEVPKKEIDE